MKGLSNLIGLKREAVLFDSRLYIFKSVLAIAAGYTVGMALPLTKLDMISVLLGVMYNLEPINILGVKGSIGQLVASTLGATCTGILILLFGINVFTVAISMGLTLYAALKINWRAVSPVAIFTSIYMTQYAQLDPYGRPSVWLTYRLRISALGLGIIIATLFNYIFSFLYYRKIAYKRLQFAKQQLIEGLNYTQRKLEGSCEKGDREYITLFPAIFNDLDLVYSNLIVMMSESRYSFNPLNQSKLNSMERILKRFRDINHLAYDINFVYCRGGKDSDFDENGLMVIEDCIQLLSSLDFAAGKQFLNISYRESLGTENSYTRINTNISSIKDIIKQVVEEAKVL